MKTKKLPVILLAILMVFSVLPIGAFAATPVTETSTASITIENALENDVLSAYKVIDITYDPSTNTLSYAWNSNFTDYFAGRSTYNKTAYTVEQFAALSSDSDAFKNLLANLPNYIAANSSITAAGTQTVAVDGTATFADLGMGEYFIRPTSSTSVYQLMLQKIEPTIANNAYVIDDVTFSAKQKEVTITKTADKTSVTKNEKVTYTITVDIPTYSANATDKSFYVSDLLTDGLTIDTASIKVVRNSEDITAQAGNQYELNNTANTTTEPYYTFKLSVSTEQYTSNWSANGGKQLVITYAATLNDNDTTEVNTKETNTATFDYSYYPYVENSHKQKKATFDVTTFAIKIDKYVAGQESRKLAGAKFDLYRTATQAEIDDKTAVVIPHTEVKGIMLESGSVTDENGAATFEKYEANGENFDYYLVETQAPSGYNLLDNAVKVIFTDTDVEATAGVYTVSVQNSSGIMLPITGGMGTVIFTALGIVLMGTALTAYIIFRKKVKAKESR